MKKLEIIIAILLVGILAVSAFGITLEDNGDGTFNETFISKKDKIWDDVVLSVSSLNTIKDNLAILKGLSNLRKKLLLKVVANLYQQSQNPYSGYTYTIEGLDKYIDDKTTKMDEYLAEMQ